MADCLRFFTRRSGVVSRKGEAPERPVWMLTEPWGVRLRGRGQALPQEPGLTVPAPRAPSPQGERSLAQTCPGGRRAAARGGFSQAQGRQLQVRRRGDRTKQDGPHLETPPPACWPQPSSPHPRFSQDRSRPGHISQPAAFFPYYNRSHISLHVIFSFKSTNPRSDPLPHSSRLREPGVPGPRGGRPLLGRGARFSAGRQLLPGLWAAGQASRRGPRNSVAQGLSRSGPLLLPLISCLLVSAGGEFIALKHGATLSPDLSLCTCPGGPCACSTQALFSGRQVARPAHRRPRHGLNKGTPEAAGCRGQAQTPAAS